MLSSLGIQFQQTKITTKTWRRLFCPKNFLFQKKTNNEPFTLTTWTDHIPIVLPVTDYILFTRQYEKLFRTVKDTVLISREKLLNEFGDYFIEFDFPNCKIIHQDKADQAKNKFNSIKSERELGEFAEKLVMEHLFNAKPE
jgi:hypothetical protein